MLFSDVEFVRLGHILVVILSLTVAYPFLVAIYNITFHPLARIPGPKAWAAFRLPYARSMFRGDIHRRLQEFHDTYGPIVRLAPNEISFTDPEAWRDIYTNRPGHLIFEKNPLWFRKSNPNDPDSIMCMDEENHARFRKILVNAFSDKSLREHANLVVEPYINMFVTKLEEMIAPGPGPAAVNLVDWFNYLTFDMAGDLSFGESFGSVKNGKAHPWVAISNSFGKGPVLMTVVAHYPPFADLFKYLIPKSTLRRVLAHRNMTKEMVHKRLTQDTDRPDYVTTIKESKTETMTEPEIEANLGIVIFAASETTSTALAGILRSLVQDERVMQKLLGEIRGSFARESDITTQSVAKLDYLGAVINEGLRMCPPTAIGVPRVVPKGGDTVCNQWLPEGTFMEFNMWPAYRSEANFHRANSFIPERSLHEGEFANDKTAAFQAFSMGRHGCIGRTLAYMELRYTLARMLWTFDIKLKDAKDVWDWSKQRNFLFWEKEPLDVVISKARSAPNAQ